MIIFTDLDGSLLQVETYSFEPAIETVHRLRAAGIPLIFCSSKTRLEQEYYQRALGISSPMTICTRKFRRAMQSSSLASLTP